VDIQKINDIKNITKNLKALYVEDNEHTREQTLKLLKNFFNFVDTACDGNDGFEKYEQFHKETNDFYDLVISDINMPNMNGVEMSKKILNLNYKQYIVVISAYNDAENLQACLQAGVSNYLHKPVNLNNLIDTLDVVSSSLKKSLSAKSHLNQIENLNQELDALIDSFDTHVIASRTDLRGKITYASKAYQEISGYTSEELIGKPHSIVRHPEMPKEAFENMWNTIQDKKLWTGEVKNLKKDGSYYWVKANIAPYYDKTGKHVGYSAIRTDITAQKEVEKLNTQVQDLLNNAGQGFLSFNENLKCESSYSKECLNIFKTIDVENKDISKLLFSENEEDKELFLNGINNIITTDNEISKELFLSLLPKEQLVHGKSIQIEYRILKNNRFMLILTDISERKKLEKKLHFQSKMQNMIVSVVSHNDDFLEIKAEFENFISNPSSDKTTLLRLLHTYKGIFAQKGLMYIVDGIHELESKINKEKTDNMDVILSLFNEFGLESIFAKDLDIINSVLGKDFFAHTNSINVNKELLVNIENDLKNIIPSASITMQHSLEQILLDVGKLYYESLVKMLSSYPVLVEQTSQKLNKLVNPLEIIGDENIVVPPQFKPFINSLVHLFNNCVDHGIEDPDERVLSGKSDTGTIKCNFEQVSSVIILEISDDGAGIDIEKLSLSALEKELVTKEKLQKMSEEEKLNLMFYDSLSTKKSATTTSGRGVGMGALKQYLDKLNGKVYIENKPNFGVSFKFAIPIQPSLQSNKCDVDSVLKSIVKQTKNYLLDSTIQILDETTVDTFQAYNNCVKIDFTDNFEGLCILSFPNEVNKALGKTLITDDFSDDEKEEMLSELPSEVANIIIGLAIATFPDHLKGTNISVPHIMSIQESQDQINKAKNKSIKEISTKHGNISCVLIKGISSDGYNP
jgi:two-component system chemotaxis sensor kinase CheA